MSPGFPVYLGVTLDRTLSFKENVTKTKAKVAARNNILDKLSNVEQTQLPWRQQQ